MADEEPFDFKSFVAEADGLLTTFKELTAQHIDGVAEILDKYQEQPQLLDPHLASLVEALFTRLNDDGCDKHAVFKCIYILTKVRGYETILRFFPHEVKDLEPTVALLNTQDRADHLTWETRYVLLLWLGVVVMVPFDLDTVDSSEGQTLITGLVDLCTDYLQDPGKVSEAAGLCLARLLTRPDVKNKQETFFQWVRDSMESNNVFLITGALHALVNVLKLGTRDELVGHVDIVFEAVIKYPAASGNTTLRELCVTIAMLLGLVYLKPRVATWRYQRGGRGLLSDNVKGAVAGASAGGSNESSSDDDDDVPEEIDSVIEALLRGLEDADTVVRWAAAKGIGKITERLPSDFGDQIVATVINVVGDEASLAGALPTQDSAWHGACLALAELARRGLLLPHRVKETLPIVLKGLQYDVLRGTHSTGAHVRDAACYVCWAFARAYDKSVLEDYVLPLAQGMLVAASFDREVNCRRAASAAFQEMVGRQGTIPHGMKILVEADYASVGNRANAYLNVALYIAGFDEFRQSLMEALLDIKTVHWDADVRQLAANSIYRLTPLNVKYMVDTALPTLVPRCTSASLFKRHGSLLALAEIVRSLHEKCDITLAEELMKKIVSLIPALDSKKKFYRGPGGDLTRAAACRVVEVISVVGPKLGAADLEAFNTCIDSGLHSAVPEVYNAAADALAAFVKSYYCVQSPALTQHRARTMLKYIEAARTEAAAARRGVVLALGRLPVDLVGEDGLSAILDVLMEVSHPETGYADAEVRRNAVQSIVNIFEGPGVCDGSLRGRTGEAFRALLLCLEDYTMDNRGDVGSWVREAAMGGLLSLARLFVAAEKDDDVLLSSEMCSDLVVNLARQSVEKIDRIRGCAGSALFEVLHGVGDRGHLPRVPCRDALETILPKEECASVNWSKAASSFPRHVQLLRLDAFRVQVLTGLVVSVGGLTESLVRQSTEALVSFVSSLNGDDLEQFGQALFTVCRQRKGVDRVMIPLFKTLAIILLQEEVVTVLSPPASQFAPNMMKVLAAETSKTKDVKKLIPAVDALCGLLAFEKPAFRLGVLTRLLLMLGHRYPKVRKTCGDQLYVALLTYDDAVPLEVADEVQEILSGGEWDGPIEQVREARQPLYTLLGIPEPKMKAPVKATSKGPKPGGYGDLVRMGY